MSKTEARYWLRRIYTMLREAKDDGLVKVRLNRLIHNYGEIDLEKEPAVVTINNAKGSFIRTMLHECIHLCDLDMPEKKVLACEMELFKSLTDRQLANVLKRVAELI